jgi:methylase of polypeptide subunit release factors
MFVQSNTLAAIKNYFSERLHSDFSESELKLMFQTVVEKRLNLSKADLILQHEIRLSESDLLHFRSVVKRLQTQEPFQYIVGSTIYLNIFSHNGVFFCGLVSVHFELLQLVVLEGNNTFLSHTIASTSS